MNPENIQEWEKYIWSLSGAELQSKARAANSLAFIKELQGEGVTASDITHILLTFAFNLESEDQVIPEGFPGEYLSYPSLLDLERRRPDSAFMPPSTSTLVG